MMKTRLSSSLVLSVFVLLFPTQLIAVDWREALKAGLAGAAQAAADEAAKQAELERQKELLRFQYELEQQRVRQQQEIFERRQREAAKVERQRQLAADDAKRKKADDEKRNALSTGTGFFIATNGYLVTNAHVVNDYDTLEIRDQTGQAFSAAVIAIDKQRDLALLKVSGTFPALYIDQLGKPTKGQRVLTIGYPQVSIQGSESKVTDGVISSLSGIRNNDDWFQISVPIQGGNSGGPLINENGLVIGVVVATVNAQKFLSITGNLPQNINYAIKTRVLLSFLDEQHIRISPASTKKQTVEAVDRATVLVIAKHGTPLGVASATPVPQVSNKVESPKQASGPEAGLSAREAKANESFQQGNAAYARRDFAQALTNLRTAGDIGHADAQYLLGLMHANGQGVSKDTSEAATWYRKSAEQGNIFSQINLGVLLETGNGIAKDSYAAVGWYRKAAQQGNAIAQNNLGIMYRDGKGVGRNDDPEAVNWFRKAAEQGNASAQLNLGFMYANGRGVIKDDNEAVAWYRKAAEQGQAQAQNNLAFMYREGRGVPKDDNEAVAWYRKAAEQGLEGAKTYLRQRGLL